MDEATPDTYPATFDGAKARLLLDVGPHGFHAHLKLGCDDWVCVATSSSMSTFLRLMSDVVKAGTGDVIEFQIKQPVAQ